MRSELMVLPDKEVATYFYRKAVACSKTRQLVESSQYFVDAFLMRHDDAHSNDSLWIDFFRLQFTTYLFGKKRVCCSLCEGDMIHDFLKDIYHGLMESKKKSEFPFSGDLHQWFSSFQVDFPWIFPEDGCICQ